MKDQLDDWYINEGAVEKTLVNVGLHRLKKPSFLLRVEFEDGHFKKQYLDEFTGDVLQHNLINEAIIEELTYLFEKRGMDARGHPNHEADLGPCL